ncbi:MAG: class I SAM-dependent methyltransferase [Planctomycetes bacterium]|jgi:SAM-dependent methyltransferase|nr:class I SAM-dependent methyltransferase [Planctomycetota bacterium]
MTIWDNIYKNYQQGGPAWATLQEGLLPQFIHFIKSNNFRIKSALDIGCGTGKYLVYLKKMDFKIAGIDSSETAIEMSKELLGSSNFLHCLDMFDFQIMPNTYDLIISISTIHHGLKKEIENLISSIYQALLPGGKIFITLPDYERAKRWDTFKDHEELELGTYLPLHGPEKGLPHSFYNKEEIEELFANFKKSNLELDERGKWIITGEK